MEHICGKVFYFHNGLEAAVEDAASNPDTVKSAATVKWGEASPLFALRNNWATDPPKDQLTLYTSSPRESCDVRTLTESQRQPKYSCSWLGL